MQMKQRRAVKSELSLSVICSRIGSSSRSVIVSNLLLRETPCAAFDLERHRTFLRGEKENNIFCNDACCDGGPEPQWPKKYLDT